MPALTTADAVEELRNDEGGFDITAVIVHPRNIAELYYGSIKGPQIQLATDAVMRGAGAKEYIAAARIFGLVNGDLYWRWDVAAAAAEVGTISDTWEVLSPHASAILKKLPVGSVQRAADASE